MLSRINKLDRDFFYWKNLSLVCPLRSHVTSLSPIRPLPRAKMRGTVNKVYCYTLQKYTARQQNITKKYLHVPGGYSLWWPIRGGSPERGTFFRLQIYERVRIPWVEVYERIGKPVIAVCERTHRHVLYCEKDKRISWFSDLFVFKWRYIYSFSKGFSSKLGMWKRYNL